MEKVQQVLSSVTGGGSKLPTAKLGKNGPQVTRLGYGCMGLVSSCDVLDIGGHRWTSADVSLERFLRHAQAR